MNPYIAIMLGALLSGNVLLNSTSSWGICPFLGVSKKTDTAIGMGLAVTFVLFFCTPITYLISKLVLVPLGFNYLQILVFVLVIATLVQLVEIVLKKFIPGLYKSLGIYLPLITTNCVILLVANNAVAPDAYTFIGAMLYAIFTGLGFTLAMVLMSGIREKAEKADVPAPFKGFPIALLSAAIMVMAFYAFSGLV